MLYAMSDNSKCSCGSCESCRRQAAVAVASYVLKRRLEQRKPYDPADVKERRYVERQVRMLLAMTGLGEESLYPLEEMQLSEWGRAMRRKQASQ